VHAFEPNPPFHDALCKLYGSNPAVVLNNTAVSDAADQEVPFYTSPESHGISSLQAFRDSHELAAHVQTVTLGDYLAEHGVKRVEFLKIDTEGFDMTMLRGVDLGRIPVDVILCEFEDRKSVPLGYTWRDQADYLVAQGYTVYVSEWHPVIKYGGPHQWRALTRFPCELYNGNAWGNFLAFRYDPGMWAVTRALNVIMRRDDNTETDIHRRVGPRTLEEELRTAEVKAQKPGRWEAGKPPPSRQPNVLEEELWAALSRVRELEEDVATLHDSTFWRLTKPLRLGVDFVRGLLGKLRH
jgi:FkbM family methyltransferase